MDNLYNTVSRRRHGQAGFTLIELLVVIAVLAILAAIVLFNVVGVTNRGKSSACATDVKTFQSAVDAAIGDALSGGSTATAAALTAGSMNGTAPNDLTILDGGGYIHDSAGTTACTTLTLAFIGTATPAYAGGATVTGS